MPIRLGSGVSSIPNSALTPSRTRLARAITSAAVAAAAVGQRQRVLGGQPGGRLVARIALVEAGVLDQPAGGQLHPVGRRVVGHGFLRDPLDPVELRRADDGVGEERADAPRVVIGRVEHHALAGPQRQHRVTHQGRVDACARLGAHCRRQLAVAQRCAASFGVEGELDLQHDGDVRVLENACAVTESELVTADPPVLAGGAVEQSYPPDRVGDLCPVRADVLHRCRAGRTRDPRQALQAAEAVLERGRRRRRPTPRPPPRAGCCRRRGCPHWPAGPRSGRTSRRPAPHWIRLPAPAPGRRPVSAQDGDDLLGGLAGDQAAGDGADTQRGQRSERHLLGDRYTPYQRTDHGP